MTVEIIAEIAQGYEGDKKLAELLVRGAVNADADVVKLQIIFADELCVPRYPYYDFFKSLEMDEDIWTELAERVHDANKRIYFDVYGEQSLRVASVTKADGVKISTTDFYNTELIDHVFDKFDTVLLSIGGIPIEDIDSLMNRSFLPKKLTLMHGFQDEPTEVSENNLNRISNLKDRYGKINIGFMDHSVGSDEMAYYLPILALGYGVNCIEKHITLDYKLEIEDYISALSIDRFSKFVKIVRAVEPAMGIRELTLTDKEMQYKKRAGKVMVAKKDLERGEKLDNSNLTMKRVSTEITNEYYNLIDPIIGKSLKEAIKMNTPIKREVIR